MNLVTSSAKYACFDGMNTILCYSLIILFYGNSLVYPMDCELHLAINRCSFIVPTFHHSPRPC